VGSIHSAQPIQLVLRLGTHGTILPLLHYVFHGVVFREV